MSIFLTGDTHSDFSRFSKSAFPEQADLTKEDYVIICGDFGGVWDDSKRQQHLLDWLEKKSFTTLFVTGNHENYELLATYPIEEWHGGNIQRIRPSVIHLMRGQIYELMGRRFFTMGGASSHDIEDGILEPDDPMFKLKFKRLMRREALFRINHLTWWKEELPDETEYQTARATLDKANWSVDYIITHCAPSSLQNLLTQDTFKNDALTDFFEEVAKKSKFRYWFFGHYHHNLIIKNKFVLLYEQIIELKPRD